MYFYKADLLRVIDGDTIVVRLDLGFSVHAEQTLRLHGINAPEPRGRTAEAGKRSAEHLADLLRLYGPLRVQTIKGREKYGRYLAVLYGGERDLNAQMVEDGHAMRVGS